MWFNRKRQPAGKLLPTDETISPIYINKPGEDSNASGNPMRRIFTCSAGQPDVIGVWGEYNSGCKTFVILQEMATDIYIEAGCADIYIRRAFNDRMVIQAYSSKEEKLCIYIPKDWPGRVEISTDFSQQLHDNPSPKSSELLMHSGVNLNKYSRQNTVREIYLQEAQDTCLLEKTWIMPGEIIVLYGNSISTTESREKQLFMEQESKDSV